MPRALLMALAIVLAPIDAVALDGGDDSGASGAGGADAAAGPMQPPDEEDPGGCACLWPDELPASRVAWLCALPVAIFAWRRGQRGRGN